MTIESCLYADFFLPLWYLCITSNITEAQCISLVFPVEQAVYNRPQPADKTRSKEGKDTVEAYQLAQRLQSMVCFGGSGGREWVVKKFDMQVFLYCLCYNSQLGNSLLSGTLMFHGTSSRCSSQP